MSRASQINSMSPCQVGLQKLSTAIAPPVPLATIFLSTGFMAVYMMSVSAYRSTQLLSRF